MQVLRYEMVGLGGALAILAGLYIVAKAVSKKEVQYHRCWNCNRVVFPIYMTCPYCNSQLDWSQGGA